MLDVVLGIALAIGGWITAAVGLALLTGGMIRARDSNDVPMAAAFPSTLR